MHLCVQNSIRKKKTPSTRAHSVWTQWRFIHTSSVQSTSKQNMPITTYAICSTNWKFNGISKMFHFHLEAPPSTLSRFELNVFKEAMHYVKNLNHRLSLIIYLFSIKRHAVLYFYIDTLFCLDYRIIACVLFTHIFSTLTYKVETGASDNASAHEHISGYVPIRFVWHIANMQLRGKQLPNATNRICCSCCPRR